MSESNIAGGGKAGFDDRISQYADDYLFREILGGAPNTEGFAAYVKRREADRDVPTEAEEGK